MFRIVALLALLLIPCLAPAAAGQKVLALQSVSIIPYDQAFQGFEAAYGSRVERLFIAERDEEDVLGAIKRERPDMVLAIGQDALLLASRLKTVPVVYCMVLNPLAICRDEKNISGVSMYLSPEKQLQALVKVMPSVRVVGLLYDPARTGSFVKELGEAADRLDLTVLARAVHDPRDVPQLLDAMQGSIDLFWMLPDSTVVKPGTLEAFLLFSLEKNVPILTFSEKYLELGAMLSIGIVPFDIGLQAGEMAKRMLDRTGFNGERHKEARKASIAVNRKIARKLGVAVDEQAIGNNGAGK